MEKLINLLKLVNIVAQNSDAYKASLIWLFGSRSGKLRFALLEKLRERPMNANQLSRALNVNYKVIRRHLDALENFGLVRRVAKHYGAPYFVPEDVVSRWDEIAEIASKY
ncbi:MAG: ArsR/SmtB family transcription factor [Thermoproteus sp.]